MIIFGREIAARVLAAVVAVIVAVIVISFATYSCDKRRSQAAQTRMERSQAEAASNSAADAIATVTRSGEAATASEELTRSNEKEIRNAEGANDAVNPAVRDAGIRSLCRRPAYRNDQRCKLLNPPSR